MSLFFNGLKGLYGFFIRQFNRLPSLSFKRQAFLLCVFGLAAPLAFAPFFWLPVLYLALSGFAIILYKNQRKIIEAFFLAWCFGFGFFLSTFYAIANALVFNFPPSIYAWPLALMLSVLLSAGMALFPAFAGMVASRARNFPLRMMLWFAVFPLLEWSRGHILTGLPWNLLGYAWNLSPSLMQSNAVLGIYGVSLLVTISASSPAFLTMDHARAKFIGFILCLGIPFIAWIFGTGRLDAIPLTNTKDDLFTVRIVQPNIPQETKWLESMAEENLRQLLRISRRNLPAGTGAILWPESATIWPLNQHEDLRRQIAGFLGHTLITGSLRYEQGRVYNSLLVLDKDGQVSAYYDKAHLVPFGEYLPFRRYIPFNLAKGRDFSAGDGYKTLTIRHSKRNISKKFAPLICYDAIFPHTIIDRSAPPDFLVNISNDAWYGKTAMPYHHVEMVRVRAVEEGRPLLRSANTGFSGAWDAWGRPLALLPLNHAAALDVIIPDLVIATPYARYGDKIFIILIFFIVGCKITFYLRFR